MDFAYSPDLGVTWLNNWGQQIANTTAEEPILPVSAGITVFSIPKYGYAEFLSSYFVQDAEYPRSRRGILNQETQAIDSEGRVHVLNRENTTGVERWYLTPSFALKCLASQRL